MYGKCTANVNWELTWRYPIKAAKSPPLALSTQSHHCQCYPPKRQHYSPKATTVTHAIYPKLISPQAAVSHHHQCTNEPQMPTLFTQNIHPKPKLFSTGSMLFPHTKPPPPMMQQNSYSMNSEIAMNDTQQNMRWVMENERDQKKCACHCPIPSIALHRITLSLLCQWSHPSLTNPC